VHVLKQSANTVHNDPSKSSKVVILAPVESTYGTFYWSFTAQHYYAVLPCSCLSTCQRY